MNFRPTIGIPALADGRGLAVTERRHLLDGLVGQRPGTGDDADGSRLADVTGHDADLALAGRDDARRVGADEGGGMASKERLDLDHVEGRDAFGDADDDADPRVGGFHDGVGGDERRHEDRRRVRALRDPASSTVLKTGTPRWVVPPLPGVIPATTFVPYSIMRCAWNVPSAPVIPWTRPAFVR